MPMNAEKAFAPMIGSSLMINSVAESADEAMSYYQGDPDVVTVPVVVVPDFDQISEATLRGMASAMCVYGEEDPEGDSTVNPGQKNWQDYMGLARAAVLGLWHPTLPAK